MNIHSAPEPNLSELQKLPVHPMAARFPMWPKDRLAELAADIKANGQHIPIVVWRNEPMLLDGRNRLAACAIAEVEPTVEFFDGEDPRKLIISRNIQTREMTASQKALLLAMEFPDTEPGGRGKKSAVEKDRQTLGFDPMLLSRAREIVRWAPEQAEGVASGTIKFAEALKTATDAKQRAASRDARIGRLRESDPDLARKVMEDELTLEGAEAENNQRQTEAASRREAGKRAADRIRALTTDVLTIKSALKSGEENLVTPELVALVEQVRADLEKLLPQESKNP